MSERKQLDEPYRSYFYAGGDVVTIIEPLWLEEQPNGDHLIETRVEQNADFEVKAGWLWLEIGKRHA